MKTVQIDTKLRSYCTGYHILYYFACFHVSHFSSLLCSCEFKFTACINSVRAQLKAKTLPMNTPTIPYSYVLELLPIKNTFPVMFEKGDAHEKCLHLYADV